MSETCYICESNNCMVNHEANLFNKYFITEKGQVINLKTNHILKQSKTSSGNYTVSLYYKKRITRFVHILVAQAYLIRPIEKPGDVYSVGHDDQDKSNNDRHNIIYMEATE